MLWEHSGIPGQEAGCGPAPLQGAEPTPCQVAPSYLPQVLLLSFHAAFGTGF